MNEDLIAHTMMEGVEEERDRLRAEVDRLRAGLSEVRDVVAEGHAGLAVKVCDRILRGSR